MTSAKLAVVLLVSICAQCLAQAPLACYEWVAQVQADRVQAEALVEQGNLRAGADLLAASWRDLPTACPELADTATASMQLLLFIMEYLMDETTVSQFVSESLDPELGDSDKFIRTVYDIAIGQDTPGKTQAAVEMTYLTESKNPFVRIGALFMLSDPYYFSNPKFVEGMNGILVRDFPNLTITQEALRLSVYQAANDDPAAIEKALPTALTEFDACQEGSAQPTTAETAVSLLQNDEVVGRLREILPDITGDPPLAIQKTCETALNAPEWRTRYGCLLIAERTAKKAGLSISDATLAALANRAEATPDVAHARVLAGDGFRNSYSPEKGQAPLDDAARETLRLIHTSWAAHPYERNLYEENLKEVQNMAEWMTQNGHRANAIQLYKALMAKYPNSIVSSACVEKLQQLGAQ